MGERYSKGMLVPNKPKVPVPKVIPQKISVKKKIKKERGEGLEGLGRSIMTGNKDKKKPYGYK